jgi:hypothetical protein
LRIDVPKCDAVLGLGDDLRRDLLAYDPAEQAIVGHDLSPSFALRFGEQATQQTGGEHARGLEA